jgi:hypothetical protein
MAAGGESLSGLDLKEDRDEERGRRDPHTQALP